MSYCKYCAQEEKLDSFGYCIQYGCFQRSGQDVILHQLEREASDLINIDRNACKQISGPVSNFYRVRNRVANDVMYKAERIFGFVPSTVLSKINAEDQLKWDRNIRW